METKQQLFTNLLNHHKQVEESYEIFNNYQQETKDLNIPEQQISAVLKTFPITPIRKFLNGFTFITK